MKEIARTKRLENDVQIQTTKIQELKSRLKEAEGGYGLMMGHV